MPAHLFKAAARSLAPPGLKSAVRHWATRLVRAEDRVANLETMMRDLSLMVDCLLRSTRFECNPATGMNGQARRKELISQLFARMDFDVVLETGTFCGETTGYLAETFKRPVHSSECQPRHHEAARLLLRNHPNIHLQLADSRQFLRKLSRAQPRVGARPFVYLDAHWYDDLPLAEEIDIVATAWRDFVILVDDFQVAGDDGYRFDVNADGTRIDLDLILPTVKAHRLRVYFPAAPSHTETGARRGCAVIAPQTLSDVLNAMPVLRPADLGGTSA